ncbi:MAG: hypothetical protein AMXMBFR58_15570 [Phycisphaerae bacterium]
MVARGYGLMAGMLVVAGAAVLAGMGAGHAAAVRPGQPASVGQDREIWRELLREHEKIVRIVRYSSKGVEAQTQSDDPAVASKIIEHAKAMQARLKSGQRVRVWDPVFAELFDRGETVTIEIEPTDRGVKIVETSEDPAVVRLLHSHAMGINEFVRHGFEAAPKRTEALEEGDPEPPSEVAIGGAGHRVLLEQPTAEQVALLKRLGAGVLVNFRKSDEHPAFDEKAAAGANDLEYCALPYAGGVELDDLIITDGRAALTAGDASSKVVVLHCRTGNRVGPVWAAYRVLDKGVPASRAFAEARAMQMVDPLIESVARDYIRRNGAGGDATGGWRPVAVEELPESVKPVYTTAVEARDAMYRRVLSTLMEAMTGQASEPGSAIKVCSEKAPQIARAVARERGLMIGRTSYKLRNKSNGAPTWARGALEQRPASPLAFVNEDGSVGVTLPIKLSGMCLMCHGDPADMDPAIKTALAAKYPDDQATGFAEGDLRGWFWVEVPAK